MIAPVDRSANRNRNLNPCNRGNAGNGGNSTR